jgi:beta-alanine--pyruvate transaminase
LERPKGERYVIDIRNMGIVAAIEIEPRAVAFGQSTMGVFLTCLDRGLPIRVLGDITALPQPLILQKTDIDQMNGRICEVQEMVDYSVSTILPTWRLVRKAFCAATISDSG